MFSPRGGCIQEKVYDLAVQSIGEKSHGAYLDIGTGNGILAVKVAQKYPGIRVTAIDYWGEDWEYSKAACERNARAAGVFDRVHFRKGDAAKLDFDPATFDGVVSILTFHEVRSVTDKRDVVTEALRVVKSGGAYAFIDYFYEPKYYGNSTEFERFVKNLGASRVIIQPLWQKIPLNGLLRHPRVLGRVGLLCGSK